MVCSAQQQQERPQFGNVLAAVALAAAVSLGSVEAAQVGISSRSLSFIIPYHAPRFNPTCAPARIRPPPASCHIDQYRPTSMPWLTLARASGRTGRCQRTHKVLREQAVCQEAEKRTEGPGQAPQAGAHLDSTPCSGNLSWSLHHHYHRVALIHLSTAQPWSRKGTACMPSICLSEGC